MRLQKAVVLTVLGAVVVTALQGCSAKSNITYAPSNSIVDGKLVGKVKDGKTPRSWVIGTFGEPAGRTQNPGDVEVLRYECIETQSKEAKCFPLLNAHETIRTQHDLYFEIENGVVRRHWSERTPLEKISQLN